MTPEQYKKQLEQKLIKEFLEKFYSKVGYFPVVITDKGSNKDGTIILTLNELEKYFDPYLDTIKGQRLKLSSKNRARSLVELRNIFCHIAKSMGYSLKFIGKYIGGRDHTTVIHNIRTCVNLCQTDDNFRNKYQTIIYNIKKDYDESSAMDNTNQTQSES
jgi:hypothetical protein